MRARVTSSRFVGRVGELAALERASREAAEQRPIVVLLGGESGVGKTRLVREFERRMGEGAEEDVLVLRGEAVEEAEGELPYAPLIGALRPLVRARHPAIDALGRGTRAQLAALLPGIDEEAALANRSDASAQLRLFEGLLELFDVLSEDHVLVITLEDLHWADRSTRTFIDFLARSLRRERVMLLLSYRTDELHRRHPLRSLLVELERLDRVQRVELEPFDRFELAEALTDILGEAPSLRLVERLYARSEGNPLYTEELLAAGLDGRGAAPQSLRDAFMLRIERLSPDAQSAARAIAAGRALDEVTISEVTGIEPDALHQALREAVAEQVLVAGEDGRLGFRHALLREAMYDDLLPGERSELHLALARALEERGEYEDDRGLELTSTVAHHYAVAGDQPAALRATVQAALAAREVHAYGDAAELAERALDLWPRVADAAAMIPLDHVELLCLAAAAHRVAGDQARAETLLQRALDELGPEADPRRYSGLLDDLSRTQWTLNRGAEAMETAQRAFALLPAEEVTPERASLLAWLARIRHLRGRYRESLKEGRVALQAALAAGDRRSESEILNTLGMSQIMLGDVDEGVSCLRGAIEIAREDDDFKRMEGAYSNLAEALGLAGRTPDGLATIEEAIAAIRRRGARVSDWMLLTASDLCFEDGDWKTARHYLDQAGTHPVGTHLIFRLLREIELALGVGDDEIAAGRLEELEPLIARSAEPQWIGAFGTLKAECLRRRRDLAGARAAVAGALDRIEICTDDVSRIARVTAAGMRVEADIAQRARDLRERADERDALARARIHMQRLRAAATEGGPVESAWKALGAAELARARGRSDAKLWVAAAREWDAISRPFQRALALWRATEANVDAGDRAAAAETGQTALEVARRVGARWLAEELTTLAQRARLDLGPAGEVSGDGATAAQTGEAVGAGANGGGEDPFGLTDRERQVLALVAEGATNRQIGAALFMAEKTASVHVSRILSKLGVRSRTQAAAVAHRLHL
ncbi:MAG: AAA family ATPase [Solirubrobacterales bacterium]|nr:AAA family ATPase [Solirubrobacterales bacterium]MBV9810323.1 AAA family ATPase [Solirubrobacterales bacterium]